MNIFILSLNIQEIAMFMMDKHVSKILLEIVQMLCTAKRILEPDDPINDKLYKKCHVNHPVSIFVRKSYCNYLWALELTKVLHNEWKYRYGHSENKTHKAYSISLILQKNIPSIDSFECYELTQFALAMPEQYKSDDPVQSYRNYYMSPEKQKFASWKKREKPDWYIVNKNNKKYIDIRTYYKLSLK